MSKKNTIPIKDLSAEVKKIVERLNKESDLSCVLIGASFLNECLGSLLKEKLRKKSNTVENILSPDKGWLGSFFNRAELVYCLGIITKNKFNDLKYIAEIRNEFAHSHFDVSFDDEVIVNLCDKLFSYKLAFPTKYFSNDDNLDKNFDIVTARDKYKITVAIISNELLLNGSSQ